MTILDTYRALYAHMVWADGAVWKAVLASDAAREDDAMRERLHHIHLVQRAFLGIWRGAPFDPRAGEPLGLDGLRTWASDYHDEAAQYVVSLAEPDLDRTVVLPWAKRIAERFGREPKTPTLGETMMQVAFHTTHHRAQVCMKLRELGGEPPMTDYIAWIWFGQPAPEWPRAA
jgi:uncharacterized damage-inducible protein DinB